MYFWQRFRTSTFRVPKIGQQPKWKGEKKTSRGGPDRFESSNQGSKVWPLLGLQEKKRKSASRFFEAVPLRLFKGTLKVTPRSPGAVRLTPPPPPSPFSRLR